MKYFRFSVMLVLLLAMIAGCGNAATETQGDSVLATTYPMYYLADRLLEGVEDVNVEVLVQEPVSCVHDYTLTTTQMIRIEQADLIIMNGSGFEHFMESALESVPEERLVDTSRDLHAEDPHTWLSVEQYVYQSRQLSEALKKQYPEHTDQIDRNHAVLQDELTALQDELTETLSRLSCRELITFHDGFGAFAEGLDLTIAAAIEEEEGAEASAQQIKDICSLLAEKHIPAIFVEKNGSTNAADIIAGETGVKIYTLNTMIDGQSDYFTAMRENAAIIKEALE